MFNGAFTGLLLATLATILVFAAVIDMRTFTISNRLNLTVAALAPLYWWSVALTPWPGMAIQLAAAATVFVLLAMAFYAGMMGGGDVKLLMAMGTVLGVRGTLELSVTTLMIAGAGAFVLLVRHGRVKVFCREVWMFFRSIVTPGLELQWPQLSRDIKAPFGIAIFLGFIAIWGGGS